MHDYTPYDPPTDSTLFEQTSFQPRSVRRWTISGFVLFASLPIFAGFISLYNESIAARTLPPGTPTCGMGEFAAMICIVFFGPVFGLIGAGCARVAAKFFP